MTCTTKYHKNSVENKGNDVVKVFSKSLLITTIGSGCGYKLADNLTAQNRESYSVSPYYSSVQVLFIF